MAPHRAIAFLLGLVIAGTAASAAAQEVAVGPGPVATAPRPAPPAAYLSGPFVPTYSSAAVPVQSVYWPPYSYWAAWPLPARDYVGYGSNDFPFYGRRYGSPSDPWSWSALAGYPALYRYYYPPVR
jgi:hypothetical protein